MFMIITDYVPGWNPNARIWLFVGVYAEEDSPPFFQPTLAPAATSVPNNNNNTTTTPSFSNATTTSPSIAPSILPPSRTPSALPSQTPSKAPTLMPSMAPSISPEPTTYTAEPTRSATPTRLPSQRPTQIPSASPTAVDSEAPSMEPTFTPQTEEVTVEMLLTTVTVQRLSGEAAIDYESVTKTHIENTIPTLGLSNVQVTTVDVDIDSQTVVQNQRKLQQKHNRNLQSSETTSYALKVTFVTLFKYLAATKQDAASWIEQSFDTKQKLNDYRLELRNANDVFSTLTNVQILLINNKKPDGNDDFTTSPVQEPDTNDDDDALNLWLIVGCAAGGTVGIIVLGLLVSRHCSKKKDEGGTVATTAAGGKSKAPSSSHYAPSGMFDTTDDENHHHHQYQYAAEINVERQDDISTLGDPMFGLMINAPSADRDERTASVAADYDYARQFLGGTTTMLTARDRVHSTESDFLSSAHTESFSKLVGDNPNRIFDDDASFEEQYGPTDGKEEQEGVEKIRVIVPPGKLGMVIDTPGGGCPVVHNIKPESILVDRIQVGDQLVSVDQEDVTQMTAVQVSKLISLRSNQTRVLVFVRHRERAYSADEDYVLDEGHC